MLFKILWDKLKRLYLTYKHQLQILGIICIIILYILHIIYIAVKHITLGQTVMVIELWVFIIVMVILVIIITIIFDIDLEDGVN